MLLYGKIVPPITQLLFKPRRRSPLSLISPQPCFPMAPSHLVLSAPIHVPIDHEHIVLRHLGYSKLWLFIPGVFVLLTSFISWCIALYNCEFTEFELKQALIILSLIGSHCNKAFVFSFETIRATPRMCVFVCPAYRITDTSLVTRRPDPVQRHSLMPRPRLFESGLN